MKNAELVLDLIGDLYQQLLVQAAINAKLSDALDKATRKEPHESDTDTGAEEAPIAEAEVR